MRKSLFLTLVLSLCIADFGAFAANARGNARGANNAATSNVSAPAAPVAARAGARQKVVSTPTAASNAVSAPAAPVAARAGARQKVVSTPKPSAGQPMAARAGATQKVINNGTKVAAATTNTAVPQKCQDAFYGCMDSFCMLDNVSGGRCQCSDRNEELIKVMDEIAKLDEQSYVMATEGVERLKMGENADAIIASAMAAGDKVLKKESSVAESNGVKKSRTLDLSAWNNNIFSEDDNEDVFATVDTNAVSNALDKKGNELYTSSAALCFPVVPEECKPSLKMLQSIYAQKIKSDCSAFENSLKQQKIASTQKLQAAEKALRDAALDEFKNQNKYATTGECVVAFTQCMQTTAECGNDFTGCVTLSAKENVKKSSGGKGATQTVIKGVVSGADITLAASTMEHLLAKKTICEHVTKQCVNANKNDAVWTAFLRNSAPALKSAEEIAEQNLRMECIPTIANCFKEACKSTIDPNDKEGSYDMCLSNPATFKHLCKIQLEPCLAATGGTYEEPTASSLWNGLLAALAAMKVDACTKEITNCLTDRCEEDFSGCIGLSTEAIINICPTDKLTACQEKNGHGPDAENTIRQYVLSIAQGLELKINNSVIAACQKAVNTAMTNACGDAATCVNATVPEKTVAGMYSAKICKISDTTASECKAAADAFSNDDALAGLVVKIIGPDMSQIDYMSVVGTEPESVTDIVKSDFFGCYKDNDTSSEPALDAKNCESPALANLMNQTWKTKVSQIVSDPKVSMCIDGNTALNKTGVNNHKGLGNLTQGAQMIVANGLMDNIRKAYDNAVDALTQNEVPKLMAQIEEKVKKAAEEKKKQEEAYNAMLRNICNSYASLSESKPSKHGCRTQYHTYVPTYNEASKSCTVVKHKFGRRGCDCGAACPFKNDPEKSKTVIFSEEELKQGAKHFSMD